MILVSIFRNPHPHPYGHCPTTTPSMLSNAMHTAACCDRDLIRIGATSDCTMNITATVTSARVMSTGNVNSVKPETLQ